MIEDLQIDQGIVGVGAVSLVHGALILFFWAIATLISLSLARKLRSVSTKGMLICSGLVTLTSTYQLGASYLGGGFPIWVFTLFATVELCFALSFFLFALRLPRSLVSPSSSTS